MPEKSKFKFVNDQNDEMEFDQGLQESLSEDIKKHPGIPKRRPARKHIKSAIIMLIASIILFIGAILWQDDTSLMAICDALWLTFALEFFAAWVLLVYNKNIFSPVTYGAKSFVLMFVGKRPKTDYYSYMKNIQDNQIEAYYYIVIFISAFILLIPSMITLLILI